ncbi:ATP-binding protein [Candidatus Amesbacteria bacterium]|nr:ATP-binding protein [Candidatus Amesbacteria bacterium]
MRRKLYTKILTKIEEPEAIVVTGMRRVGKTTLIKQVYESLESANKIFLDLENPVVQKYFENENYDSIKYQFEVLGIRSDQKAFVFLDEIQMVKNAPSVVKYLIDHYNWKFFLTGSSSFYLKNLFSESLAGRKSIFELFPLDFEEFLLLKGSSLKIPKHVNKPIYQTFEPLYREFVEFGGFPGVINKKSQEEKTEALSEIFTSYYNKEVLGIGGFKNNQVIRDLMLLLANRVGSKVDVQKLATELGVTRVTINEYLAFLEGTYFVFSVNPFSTDRDVEIRGAKKIYFCDSGLARILGKTDPGQLFENAIFQQLKNKGQINYYQRKSGVEVDFVLNESSGWEIKTKASGRDIEKTYVLIKDIGLQDSKVVSFDYTTADVIYGFQI